MDLTVRLETQPDFAETARLANEAFGTIGQAFTAERLDWLYTRAFASETRVLGLFADGRKVGQVALLGQVLGIGDAVAPAIALVDLFILPAFRSREAMARLYGQVEAICGEAGIRVILAVPNVKAISVNRRLLKLETAATLDIRAGVAAPFRSRRVRTSADVGAMREWEARALFARFEQRTGTGLRWTAERLWGRLQDPSTRHAVHATDDLLLISAAKVRRTIPMTLICGLLPRPGAAVGRSDIRALVAAACRLHRRPLFVYIGRNARVPVPGWLLPPALRPSIMIVQARDLLAGDGVIDLERFELIDFDFA